MPAAKPADATGKLLIPALVDLHFHTAIAKVCSVSIVYD